MILYLLKSALCLLIFLLVHRLIFQREAIYQFNRFYLLGAVIGSFFIPLVELEIAPEKVDVPQEASQQIAYSSDFQSESDPILASNSVSEVNSEAKPFDWELLLWSVYGLITLVFLIRFLRNIHLLLDKINRNIHVRYRGETLVLLKEQSLPFSFLSYIFISKDYFESQQLTDAIFAHEKAHVQGKHSWDNLLIEALLVPFWFHPGLYFARQAIKLNHEFIADEAALQVTPLAQYKSLLLLMMLPGQSVGLASSLNFSLTKKRFEMMKRKTTNPTKWIKILFVLPVLAAMVYIFSEKVIAQAEEEEKLKVEIGNKETAPVEKKETNILLRKDGKIEVDGQIIEVEQLAELIDSENNFNKTAHISGQPDVEMGFLADVKEVLRGKDIRRVVYQSHLPNENGSIKYPIPTRPEYRQTTLAAFKELNGAYQVKLNQKGSFAKKSDLEIEQLFDIFTSLHEKYSGLSYEDKRIIRRPTFPYVRLEKDGNMVFKRLEDLTEEERKTLRC